MASPAERKALLMLGKDRVEASDPARRSEVGAPVIDGQIPSDLTFFFLLTHTLALSVNHACNHLSGGFIEQRLDPASSFNGYFV